jgi:hypothetical protein
LVRSISPSAAEILMSWIYLRQRAFPARVQTLQLIVEMVALGAELRQANTSGD